MEHSLEELKKQAREIAEAKYAAFSLASEISASVNVEYEISSLTEAIEVLLNYAYQAGAKDFKDKCLEALPETRRTTVFHSSNDGDFVENDWDDCLRESRKDIGAL